ncbi:MAG: hypothetical protein ACK5DG_11835 [Chitinophagaceae bacterium]|jgi:hypothetical protein
MKQIILLSSFLFWLACNNSPGFKKTADTMQKTADTVTIFFFNASLPPEKQFFSTIKLFKYAYAGKTEFGDSSKGSIETKGTLEKDFWTDVSTFSPEKLIDQSQEDGECFTVYYTCKDSVYVDYRTTLSDKERKLISLIKQN